MIKDKLQRPGFIALGVFLSAIVAYLPSLGAGFFWDTPAVFGGDSFFLLSFEHGYYRPLFDLVLQAERALWGEAALGYHLFNLLLHATNSVLLFFIVRRLVSELLTSALAAFLFALHPAHVEAVTWVFAQPWLIGAFLSLCSFLLYLNSLGNSSSNGPGNGLRNNKLLMAIASALFAFLAMLSYQAALVLPVFLVACGWLLGAARKQRILGLLLYAMALGVYAVFFLGAGEFRPAEGTSVFGVVNTLFVFGFYILKIFLPFSLAVLPTMPSSILYPFMGLLPFAVGYILYTEGMRREIVPMVAMLVLMVPALMIAFWDNDYSVGFRFMYMPLMASSMFVAMVLARIRAWHGQAFRLLVSVLLIASISGALWNSVKWTDNEGLWREVAENRPDRVSPLLNLAATLAGSGNAAEAEAAIRSALSSDQITTDHYAWITRLYDQMGSGEYDGQRKMYEDLVATRGEAHAMYIMGFIHLQKFEEGKQDIAPALEYFRDALALDDKLTPAHYYLALVYVYQHKYEAARDEFIKVRDADEKNANWTDSIKFLDMLNGVNGPGSKDG